MDSPNGEGLLPISAAIITLDAEQHLDRVLQPLAACAEILILDSGSSDRTREIADAHGAQWHAHPFDGYGPQKRRAVSLARYDWVLSIDSDEILDQDAVAALRAINWARADPTVCWEIRRRPFIGEREIRHGDWAPDFVVRVFNRRHHGFSDALVHESVRTTGRARRLNGSLLHFTAEDYAGVFRTDYYRLKADMYRRRGRRAGAAILAARAIGVFLRCYLLRLGFLDGVAGVVLAVAGAANTTVGLAQASDPRSQNNLQG